MPENGKTGYSYAGAGVDIAAGDALVEAIRPAAAATRRAGADAILGGFGGLFDPVAAGFRDPILVAATDGVGTKLEIAARTGRHDGIGIDLVAMCVNDILVQGAEPLFFLDYFATGRLDGAIARRVVEGIAEGCRIAGCALIGGETAEMPGMYAPGSYDLAGFAVGAAERGTLLDGSRIAAGDILLGIASSGVHANGFSLVRRILADLGLADDAPAPFEPARGLAEALLTPTRIYVRSLLPPIRAGRIKGLAHITGGGLTGNVPRCLPAGCEAAIGAAAWPLPPVFVWLAEAGSIAPAELQRTFNCGIGMVAAVAPEDAETVLSMLAEAGETAWRIGRIEARDGPAACRIEGDAGLWGSPDAFRARSYEA